MPLALPLVGPSQEFVQMLSGQNVAGAPGFLCAEQTIRTGGFSDMLEYITMYFCLNSVSKNNDTLPPFAALSSL